MRFSQIIAALRIPVEATSLSQHPALDPEITGVAAVDQSTLTQLSYIEGERYAAQISVTGAGALILPKLEALTAQATERGLAWLVTPHPRLVFAQAIALFYQPFQPAPQIHPTALIDDSVQLGERVSVGAHVTLQAGVTVGDDVCIHPNVVVYPNAVIGERTVLHANCVIQERSQIGADCVIHSGAVIGGEGFGFVPTPEGWYKMHQSGCVVLEPGVEVGCNSAIDRPSVGETRIGRGTKIDNLVQIAHGCQIGQHCVMSAQVGLSGQVELGERVILAGQVGVANQVKIGNGAIATAQTGIPSDVEAGAVVSGYPAIPNKLWLKATAVYRRLPEIYQTLRQLQK